MLYYLLSIWYFCLFRSIICCFLASNYVRVSFFFRSSFWRLFSWEWDWFSSWLSCFEREWCSDWSSRTSFGSKLHISGKYLTICCIWSSRLSRWEHSWRSFGRSRDLACSLELQSSWITWSIAYSARISMLSDSWWWLQPLVTLFFSFSSSSYFASWIFRSCSFTSGLKFWEICSRQPESVACLQRKQTSFSLVSLISF